jgi:uncharacterized protein (TIGR01777 family)
MQTILITGGTGLIGKALTSTLLSNGNYVIVLTRGPSKQAPRQNLLFSQWNPEKQQLDPEVLNRADAIIHLAGANVAEGRWTEKRKKEIIDSRVQSGQLLVQSLHNNMHKVKTLVSASAIGYYGPDADSHVPFREYAPAYHDFLGSTVVKWESSVDAVAETGIRLIKLRTGIVLANEGGAYPEFKKTLPLGMATILGSGKQIVSWIHIDDLVNMYITAVENEKFSGTYNAVAPHPVSNEKLIRTIVSAKQGRKIFVKVPDFILKTMLGEMSIEVLKSTTVSAERIISDGFVFSYPDIDAAIRKLEDGSSH